MGYPVVYFEIGADDNESLKRFYSELFGWRLESLPPGGYTMIDTAASAGLNGGIGHSSDGTPWATFYVEVDDPQAVLNKAESLGGKTVVPVTEIPGVLTWAMFNDPDSRLVGLVKQGANLSLTPSSGERPAVDWFEVLGSNGERTWEFYSQLFGWTANGNGPYWLVDTGAGRGIAGGVGGGGGSRWATIYAHVPDIDQALARAEQLGGKREYGPNQVDDHMRSGAIRDPAGNIVGVYEHKH
jgi:uncharacterized protein